MAAGTVQFTTNQFKISFNQVLTFFVALQAHQFTEFIPGYYVRHNFMKIVNRCHASN